MVSHTEQCTNYLHNFEKPSYFRPRSSKKFSIMDGGVTPPRQSEKVKKRRLSVSFQHAVSKKKKCHVPIPLKRVDLESFKRVFTPSFLAV